MKVLRGYDELQRYRCALAEGVHVGFVPTMGALHEGHQSLARHAVQECDVVLVSIFVNPTQFAAGEDLETYPRTEEQDLALLESEGVSAVWCPHVQDIYAEDAACSVTVRNIIATQEGSSRPHFFDGVATVCTKLFNAVRPHTVFFGQKDGLQCIVIRRLIQDLLLPIRLIICPTVRASDGLALSSRNAYLNTIERRTALHLYSTLQSVASSYVQQSLPVSSSSLLDPCRAHLSAVPGIELQYLSIADTETGIDVKDVLPNRSYMLSIAALVGSTRLIDNITLGPQ